ncbi:eukaryotic translation initiation factor 3 subunit M-like isoform X2 [Sycon ciliatum]|uniref:eukaryotic translation initiation factor 3 subunit M-like isoform X2 n=1 Tax=Sycon ciliatum TaxID=27933 RepID=UPI0031F6FD46
MSSAPAFIDVSEQAQAEELLEYYESRGQKLAVTVADNGMSTVVHALAEHCGICLRSSDEDSLATMTSIFSLFHMVPPHELGTVVLNICKQIGSEITEKNAKFRFALLKTLFSIIEDGHTAHRADVWLHMLLVARKGNFLRLVTTDPAEVQKNFESWKCSTDKQQHALRSLHDILQETGKTSSATDALVLLLSMYTNPGTAQAREDAKKCILDSIREPKTYLFDRLLRLPAVQQMKDDALFKLLNIFVSGTFSDFIDFNNANKSFVEESGLDASKCEHKMRLLTFVSLAAAAAAGEVSFATMKQDLSLETDEDAEMLVLDAIHSRRRPVLRTGAS